MDSLTMTEPTHGLVRIHGTVEQVAEMLTNAGYPKDAERLLAAQAKRDRKAAKRRHHAVMVIDDGGYIVRAGGAAMLNDGAYEPVPT